MPSSLASKEIEATGQVNYIETVDHNEDVLNANAVGIRDDLIIADGEKDVSHPQEH